MGLDINPDYARAIIEEVDVRLLRVTLAGYEKHFVEKTGASTRAVARAETTAPEPKHSGARVRGEKQAYDVSLKGSHGNSAAYLAARIKRDHPDVHARTLAGEFSSTHAAAKVAGIIKTKDPVEKIISAFRKLSPEDKKRFMEAITEILGS